MSLVPMFILVSACVSQGSGFGLARGELPEKKSYESPASMPDCTDSQYKEKSALTITVNNSQVVVAPQTICVLSPGEIRVNVNFTGRRRKIR